MRDDGRAVRVANDRYHRILLDIARISLYIAQISLDISAYRMDIAQISV